MSILTGSETAPSGSPGRRSEGDTPVPVDPGRHATTWLWERSDAPNRDAVRHWVDGSWKGLTRPELAERVRAVAAGLVAAGVGAGDRVVLMGRTSLEWTVADLAVLAAGAVTVPVYETSTVEQCRFILTSSQARIALADGEVCRARLEEAWGGAGPVLALNGPGLDQLAGGAADGHREEVTRRLEAVDGASPATIIYTSGTTGSPKGCLLTHANIVWTSAQCRARLSQALDDTGSMLLFLPLAHVFARVVQFVCLEAGVPVGYAQSLARLKDDLATFQPTLVLAVPAVLQRVFDRARSHASGRLKAGIFGFAVRTADACSRPSAGIRHRVLDARRLVADRLVYARVRHGLGGRLRYCVSGGAPLPVPLARFFQAAGITVLEGYGLTETSAPLSVNVPGQLRLGTVGRPLPGVAVRLADDGEILVRGGNVFAGYLDDRDGTAAALADGWLRTGDLGSIDDDGFVTVTGRKKDLIVMSTGKKVAPAPLEDRLRAHPLVADAVVVGEGRPYVVALLALDPEAMEGRTLEGASLKAELQRAVDDANRGLSRPESIRAFAVLPRALSQEDGELTPTLKVRRSAVVEHFGAAIAAAYEPGPRLS
ncbi:MAG: AMP-dependent synthetase/ligase [Acidimicrobiales bacterium]